MGFRLPRPKRGFDGFEQCRVAEWFEEALHGTMRNETWAKRLVTLRGDEDDRNGCPATYQFLLEIWSAHTGQPDVENQTVRLSVSIRREELFRRGERLHGEAERLQ